MRDTIILNIQNDKLIFSINSNEKFEEKHFKLNKNLDLMGNIIEILNDKKLSELERKKLSLKDKQIFIIDKSTISLKYRKDMAQILFELLDISAFYIASQSILALYDNNITSGLVIDYFDDQLFAIPIFNENIIKNAVSKIMLDEINKKNITKKINSTVYKCKVNQQNEIKDNIVYSTSLPKELIENIDDFTGDIILGDPIIGAKKIIPLLNLHNCWVTKEKYKETGSYIVEKKCSN